MNWLRIILDSVILSICFCSVVATSWVLHPQGFYAVLPRSMRTSFSLFIGRDGRKVKLMRFLIILVMFFYMIFSTIQSKTLGFWNYFFTAYIEFLVVNFSDFIFLDLFLRNHYSDKILSKDIEDLLTDNSKKLMMKGCYKDHFLKGPFFTCPLGSLLVAAICILFQMSKFHL